MDSVEWPQEKTEAENKQTSQCLQRQRSPAAFQVLGISRAIPIRDTHHSDTLVCLSWPFGGTFSYSLLRPCFPMSVLKYNTCTSQSSLCAALLQLSAVTSYLLATAAFTDRGRVRKAHLTTPQQRDKQLQRPSQTQKRDFTPTLRSPSCTP